MSADIESLRYPIGKFSPREAYTADELKALIDRIESLPARVEMALKALPVQKLETPYREGGWTVRQLVHHMADSHMNAFVRFKWTLTEPTPIIKPYDEKAWAQTYETKLEPEVSLTLLKALHTKWVALLKGLTTEDLQKQFYHPDTKKHVRLDNLMGLYAWHGDHHLAHIKMVRS